MRSGHGIAAECGIEYEGRSGLIALLHRLGMEHRKPTTISRKLDPAKQAVFIRSYEALLNQLPADDSGDVRSMRCIRRMLCEPSIAGPPEGHPADGNHTQSSGRERLNIHGRDRS